ncbi:Response regulator receiver domain-containing protein [Chryseolinea serpens]|jgi:CheY-like chemotaxis protein|uniref:Response regulator receiver domain-containing protein n=1 Tax=Chryseolinea serpens TaxID=947013 RepID=A0A1M5WXV7_9BACT|nr:response regulator [Chryseolinea serpens]SHH92545.1 Response regulator receiver domain-containing protein [Chryseolinea serpens]
MRKVLVVDDEMEICLLVTQYLKKLGYEAAFALSISEAISKIAGSSYDILFIDLNLTDGSGYDLIHALQASNNASKIVVISAYDSERQKALQKGASVFMAKPFSVKTIEESLQQLKFIN